MITVCYIGLIVIALLNLWNSYILTALKEWIGGRITNLSCPSLSYFYECDYCKGFWMCVLGGIIAGNGLYILPAYGIVVIGLSIKGINND